MDVHFLGTIGWAPNDRGHTSCVMIPEIGVVFDAGTGFYRVRDHVKTPWIDIFLSHLHDDHICATLYVLAQLENKNIEEVNIYGRKGVGKFLARRQFRNPRFPLPLAQHEELAKVHVWTSDELFREGVWGKKRGKPYQACGDHWIDYSYHVFPSSRFNWQATMVNMPHPSGGSLATIIDITEVKQQEETLCWRVAYVTDTSVDLRNKRIKRLVKMLQTTKGVLDLLILECNFANRHAASARMSGHSWPAVAIDFIQEIRPRRVALTHHHTLADRLGSDFMGEDVVAAEEVRKEIPHAIHAEDNQIVSL